MHETAHDTSPYSELARKNRRLRMAVAVLSCAVIGLVLFVLVGGRGNGGAGATKAPGDRGSVHEQKASDSAALRSQHRRKTLSMPSVLVGVTTSGVLEDLDPSGGAPVRTLASGVAGDEVDVSPDHATVYFESATGCLHEIEKVSVTGGSPEVVASGSVPAISPDGSQLAYVRQPLGGPAQCPGQSTSASAYTLVVRQLSTGAETTYPVSPQLAGGGPEPIDHLSRSFDGRELAVSVAASPGNQGFRLVVIHPATDEYYFTGSGVPVTGTDAPASYYREGAFMPDGDLFVNRVCCEATAASSSSTLLIEIDPSTGAVVHQVAVGILGNDHTSLESDSSGHWLLYLSGNELLVSEDGGRPFELTTGLAAAAW
jgi:hypothetical protein